MSNLVLKFIAIAASVIPNKSFQKDKKWHASIADLAKKVGLEHYYETIYRVGSGAEHGTWHYLQLYQLEEKEKTIEHQLKYSSASPTLLEAANYVCLNATKNYIKNITPDKVFLELIQTIIK